MVLIHVPLPTIKRGAGHGVPPLQSVSESPLVLY